MLPAIAAWTALRAMFQQYTLSAGDAGTLPQSDASTLLEAHELIVELRVEHQVAQLQAGATPDDHIDPATLSALTRSHLKEAFRAVAAVQKRVAAELQAVSW